MTSRPNPEVLWQRLDDEVLLLHMQSDRVFSLNTTAARLWELLVAGVELDSIRARLAEEFEVPSSDLAKEVEQLIALMIDEQLVIA